MNINKSFLKTLILSCFFSISLFCPFYLSYAQTQETADPVSKAGVAPFGETLFTVYGDNGSVTAEKRAKIISENISKLSKDAFFKLEYLKIESSQETVNILYKNEVIAGITTLQSAAAGKPKIEVAHDYLALISEAVQHERKHTLKFLRLEEIGVALLIILLTILCIKGLNMLLRHANNILLRKKQTATPKEHDVTNEVQFTFKIIKILRIVLALFILAICFLILLWLFPSTRWAAESLLTYIEKPLMTALLSLWHYIPNVIEIIIILALFRIFERILNFFAKRIASGSIKIKSFESDWAMPTFQILRILIIVFAFIFIFPLLPKADSSIFKGISVFMGVLLSLGSTSMISNIVSGLVITYMRPFNVGDRIKMGEHFGDVIEKNSLVTRIKTTKNEIVTIPNSAIMTANTTNYTNSAKNHGLILHSEITIGYSTDWRKVHELLIEAGLKTKYVMQEPKPFVQQKALDDFYVVYQINVFIKNASEMTNISSDLFQNILDVFNRAKVEILSPHINGIRNDSGPVFYK